MLLREMLIFIPALIIAYAVGSVPFGLYLGKLKGLDIREHGSGNVGATNVWRVCGKSLGVLCFVLDAVKGAAPVLAFGYIIEVLGVWAPDPAEAWMWLAVAAAAVAGHMFPIWLRGRGGKGIATGFGALLALWPLGSIPAMLALIAWILIAATSRYVSLASIGAALTLPVGVVVMVFVSAIAREDHSIGAAFGVQWPVLVVTLALALVVIWKHRGNLSRIQKGVEPRIGDRNGASAPGRDRPVREPGPAPPGSGT